MGGIVIATVLDTAALGISIQLKQLSDQSSNSASNQKWALNLETWLQGVTRKRPSVKKCDC